MAVWMLVISLLAPVHAHAELQLDASFKAPDVVKEKWAEVSAYTKEKARVARAGEVGQKVERSLAAAGESGLGKTALQALAQAWGFAKGLGKAAVLAADKKLHEAFLEPAAKPAK